MNCTFLKSSSFLFISLIFFYSCSTKDDIDLVNIYSESNSQNFQENTGLSEFPSISILTNGLEIVDDPKINAEMIISENDTEKKYNIGIEIRGSSSQMFPKKSYGFETKNEDWTQDKDESIGGFPEEEDWILYGPYSDKSLIRNKLTFDLSNLIGFKASNTKFYNLFIEYDFKGLYILMEKIKRDLNRVNITEHTDEGLNGGYILKIDKSTGDYNCGNCYDESFSFRSKYDTSGSLSEQSQIYFIYDYPKPEEISENQKNYIKSMIFDFETALLNEDDNYIDNLIDINSFVDFMIINELTKNPDGFRLSTYMHKDLNGKIKMGPIWDFNLAFGNVDYCDGANPQGWIHNFNDICPGDLWQVPFWWKSLMNRDIFKSSIKNRWNQLRTSTLSESSLNNLIDSYVNYLSTNKTVDQNFSKWPILGQYIWPNYFVGSSYQEEIEFLKNWLNQRLEWMDNEISSIN